MPRPAGQGGTARQGARVVRAEDPAHHVTAWCRLEQHLAPRVAWPAGPTGRCRVARSGFQPPDMPIGHVMGLRGDIVAILWGGPKSSLYAPPLPHEGNNVLWVPRLADEAGAPLTIRAMLNGTHRAITRELPDVGPSSVDLPAPGCWTGLELVRATRSSRAVVTAS